MECIDTILSQIEKGLYLGSARAANDKALLKSLNVTHVLTVATSLPPKYPNDFMYKVVKVHGREDEDIAQFFDDCFGFIDEAKRTGGVLVHCFMGVSCDYCCGIFDEETRMSLSEALNFVRRKRSVACPNLGFMLQLQIYEKSLQVTGSNIKDVGSEATPSVDASCVLGPDRLDKLFQRMLES